MKRAVSRTVLDGRSIRDRGGVACLSMHAVCSQYAENCVVCTVKTCIPSFNISCSSPVNAGTMPDSKPRENIVQVLEAGHWGFPVLN